MKSRITPTWKCALPASLLISSNTQARKGSDRNVNPSLPPRGTPPYPRVAVFADLTVQGYTENNEKFKVQTRFLSVSGNGGMTILDAGVVLGQTLLVTNENSGQKTECKVVSLRPGGDGKSIVAFEFMGPCANFWKMTFPAQGAKPLRRVAPAAINP